MNGQITIASLYHEAIQNGWKDRSGHYKPRQMSESERAERERRVREAQEKDAREAKRAAELGAAVWKSAQALRDDHPQIGPRGVKPTETLREIHADEATKLLGYRPKAGERELQGRLIVAPLRGPSGFVGVELRDESGLKTLLYGTAPKGAYWAPQALPDGDGDGMRLLIGEGVVTMLSAQAAGAGHCIGVRTSGNLMPVCVWARERYPKAHIVVLGERGGGYKQAQKAAEAIGADLASFDEDANALHNKQGLAAVKEAIEAAQRPATVSEAQPAPENRSGAILAGEWPEPKPVLSALKPVASFNADVLLPEPIRSWVVDEADRMPCAPELVAVPALVSIGSIVSTQCAIKPKNRDDWAVTPNVWGGVVGGPSVLKSPAREAALRPLSKLVAQAISKHESEMLAYETRRTVKDAQREAIENKIKAAAKDTKNGDVNTLASELLAFRQADSDDAPQLRRYKTNDATVAKLGELLRDSGRGVLVERDELVGLWASWDQEGNEPDRAFFLEAWNGTGSFDTDRIGRGSILIKHLCVSIFGGIQPDKLTGYLERAAHSLGNDGMVQRFQLLVFPDAEPWKWRDRLPAREARDEAFKVFEALAEFCPEDWGASPADDFVRFPHFRFDAEAQELYIQWMSELQARIPQEDSPIIAQHLAKYPKLYPALALIFHLIECAAYGRRGDVGADSAIRAAAWCQYLEAHARRCYGLLADDGLRAAQMLSEKLRRGKLADGFTARDVRRHQWRSLTTDEAVRAALDWLTDDGWLRPLESGGSGPGGGRRTTRYQINPKARTVAAIGEGGADD